MYHNNFSNSIFGILGMTLLGIISWTLGEYIIHRFGFHCEDSWFKYLPHSRWTFLSHFLIHGIHHAFPQDRERIVFPPVPGWVLIFYPLIYRPLQLSMSPEYFYNFYFGLAIGY